MDISVNVLQPTGDDQYHDRDDDGGHGLAVQEDGTVVCTLCCKTLKNKKSGKNHFSEVHQVQHATCPICKAVVKKRSIYMHYKKHGVTAASIKNMIRMN